MGVRGPLPSRWSVLLVMVTAATGCIATGESDGPGRSDRGTPVEDLEERADDIGFDEPLDSGMDTDLLDVRDGFDLEDPSVSDQVEHDQGDGRHVEDLQEEWDEHVIQGSVLLDFEATVAGRGTGEIGVIDIAGNVGSIERDGTLVALLYQEQQWVEYDLTLYHAIAPERDNLHVMYLYCSDTLPSSLDLIWHESYDSAMGWQTATGSCSSVSSSDPTEVELVRLRSMPQPSQLVQGFTVSGSQVSLNGSGGSVTIGGTGYDAFPFEAVDCTTECSADPADGWWELHMVLENQGTGEVCFTILYLEKATPDRVSLGHGFCLESLTFLPSPTLAASWSAPPSAKSLGIHPPSGPRHPQLGYVLRPGPVSN